MARELSRQAFVRGALGAVGAGALLGSCRPSAPALQIPPTASSPPTTPVVSAQRSWSALADALEGRVILPSSVEYAGAKNLFNTRFDKSKPAAVVAVQSIADVQKAVAFAANNGIKIAARSGGHSYIGASSADGAMVIALRQLPAAITYDDGRAQATVSAAADLDSVQTALAAKGRSIAFRQLPDRRRRRRLTLGGWRVGVRYPAFGSDVRCAGVGICRIAQ